MPRVIFSPTTTPMLPPMKPYSMAATTTGMPSSVPLPTMIASRRPVAAWLARRRSRYGLVSVKPSGSLEESPASCSSHGPSRSDRSRSAAVMRKWCAHFGHTWRLVSRSLL